MLRLYTTHCPACEVVESMLKEGGVEYDVVDDEDAIFRAADLWGFTTVPFASDNGKVYSPKDLKEYATSLKQK